MAARRINEPFEPMTLGNMRANGVHSLAVSCHVPPRGDHQRSAVAG